MAQSVIAWSIEKNNIYKIEKSRCKFPFFGPSLHQQLVLVLLRAQTNQHVYLLWVISKYMYCTVDSSIWFLVQGNNIIFESVRSAIFQDL